MDSGSEGPDDTLWIVVQIDDQDKCLGFFYIGYPEVEWPKGQRKPIEYVTEWIES